MDKNLQIPGLYTLRYESAEVVPAPFSNYYSIKLDIQSESKVDVDFEMRYTDRDDLSEDEIYDEGFTTDDDFKWRGRLPELWISEFSEIFASSKTIRKREENEYEDFIEIELEEDQKRVTIYPVDKERWSYFLQEIMQAIFEKSGREKPFELTYLEIEQTGTIQIDLSASFANKQFIVSKDNDSPRKMEWEQLQRIMDTIYRAEFIADQAVTSKPSKRGKYLSAGDGLWYQIGVAVVETTSKSKDISKIEALFSTLADKF